MFVCYNHTLLLTVTKTLLTLVKASQTKTDRRAEFDCSLYSPTKWWSLYQSYQSSYLLYRYSLYLATILLQIGGPHRGRVSLLPIISTKEEFPSYFVTYWRKYCSQVTLKTKHRGRVSLLRIICTEVVFPSYLVTYWRKYCSQVTLKTKHRGRVSLLPITRTGEEFPSYALSAQRKSFLVTHYKHKGSIFKLLCYVLEEEFPSYFED